MDNITKQDLISAMDLIDKNGIPSGRHSTTYDLAFNGKLYPPLLVVSYANKISNGEEFAPNTLQNNPNNATCDGMLLYPTVQKEIDSSFQMGTHKVRVATVDLSQDWSIISDRLLNLIPN